MGRGFVRSSPPLRFTHTRVTDPSELRSLGGDLHDDAGRTQAAAAACCGPPDRGALGADSAHQLVRCPHRAPSSIVLAFADQRLPSRKCRKHVWDRQCLMYEGRRLLDGKRLLCDAGLGLVQSTSSLALPCRRLASCLTMCSRVGPEACVSFADYRPPDPRGRYNY